MIKRPDSDTSAIELDGQLKRNRIKNIEKDFSENWTKINRFAFFKKKAVLFPVLGLLIFAAVIFHAYWTQNSLWHWLRGKESPADIGLSNKNQPQIPALPPDNRDLDEGKGYYLKGWYPAAQSAFERVINSASPDSHKAVALTYLGMIAYDQEQYVRAIDFFERALKYNAKDVLIYRNLSLVYRRREMLNDAEKYAKKALELEPKDAKNYLLLGNIFFDKKMYKPALEVYQKGLSFAPDEPILLYNSGLAAMQIGDMPAASNHFHLAAQKGRVGQVAINSYRNLARIYSDRKDWARAIEYLQAAIKLAPKNSDLFYDLGVVQLSAGLKKEALASFELALLTGEASRELYEKLGDAYTNLQLTKEGIKAYNQSLAKGDPGNVPILAKLAELYYKDGDLKKAEEMNRKIIALAPGSNDAKIAYLNMGNILHSIGQYDQAVDMYQRASDLDPTDDKPWINIALSYHAGKKIASAIEAFKKAIQVNPDNIKPRMALAELYLGQGFFSEALDQYVKLIQSKPDLAPAHFQLAKLYHQRGQYSEAISGYQQVIKLNIQTKEGRELVQKSHLNLALLLSKKNDVKDPLLTDQQFTTALSHVKTAIQMEPEEPEGYLVLAEVYLARNEMGDLEKAIEAVTQLLSMTQVDKTLRSRGHNLIGKIYFLMQRYNDALREFSRALEEWPGNEEAALNRKTAAIKYEQSLR